MSRICGQEPAAAGGAGGAGGMDDGGMDWMDDPNMDPDLALALRVSLEESRARQQQEAQQSTQANVHLGLKFVKMEFRRGFILKTTHEI